MDFKDLIPDFDAIKKTNWSQRQFDKSNKLALVAMCAIVLMAILVFLPWFRISHEVGDVTTTLSRLGITTWYGIFAFIFTIVAAVGVLYNHRALAFWAAVICVILAIIGLVIVPSLSALGVTIKADVVKEMIKSGGEEITVSRLFNVFYLIAAVVTAGCTYMLAMGKEIKK